jgi:hypothetical protein
MVQFSPFHQNVMSFWHDPVQSAQLYFGAIPAVPAGEPSGPTDPTLGTAEP